MSDATHHAAAVLARPRSRWHRHRQLPRDVGHEIPTALLPTLLTATLGAPAAAALGLIGGAGAPTAAAAGPTGPDRTPGPADGRGVGVRVRECGRTLLTLRASELLAPGHDQDRATQLALGLYVAYIVAATLVSIPAGRLGDRRGAVLVLVLGVGLFGLACAGFAAGPASVLALVPWFVTVMLSGVPAWVPDRVGAGRESGSDRNRPSSTMDPVALVAAWHGRLTPVARVAHS